MAENTKKTTPTTEAPAKSQNRETLCTFALRMTKAERDAVHKAAGPRGASTFARRVLAEAAAKEAAE